MPQQPTSWRDRTLILPLLFLILLPAKTLQAQSEGCLGYWKTIDDETNKARAIVQIYKQQGKYHGKIVKLFREPDEDPDPYCDKCDEDDSRYNQRVLGMVILTDLAWDADDNEWDDGEILDPDNGSVYDCYLALESRDKLKVRGFLGLSLLGRTQYWYRTEAP